MKCTINPPVSCNLTKNHPFDVIMRELILLTRMTSIKYLKVLNINTINFTLPDDTFNLDSPTYL